MAYQSLAATSRAMPPLVVRRGVNVKGAVWRALRFVRLFVCACLQSYELASTYDRLNRLSDAELRRLGFNRRTLAYDVMDRSGQGT